MKNYRLTQRGKIVFTGLFIAIIVALVLMVTYFNNKIDPVGKELMINTEEIEKSNETAEETIKENTMDNGENAVETSTDPSSEVKKEETTNATNTISDSSVNVTIDEDETNTSDNESNISDADTNIEKDDLEIMYTMYYAPDEYKVDEKHFILLDNYYDIAIGNKSNIIIEGNYHIGKDYDEKMFAHLSYKRALHAKQYLVNKGIDENRIIIIDNKNLKSLNEDASDLQVRLNRRVDIYFEDFYKKIN